jgi:hypothetical protein
MNSGPCSFLGGAQAACQAAVTTSDHAKIKLKQILPIYLKKVDFGK